MAATESLSVRLESDDFSCDRLQVHRLSGREAISELFCFDLDVVSLDEGGLDPEAVLGARASVVLERDGREVRRVHGLVSEVGDAGTTESDTHAHRLRLVPRVHQLALVELQEIFVGQGIPEIVRQKLLNVGLAEGVDFDFRLLGAYPAREMVVQYQETDLAFVRRWLEHLGISFFFEHEVGCDRMVITDHPAGFRPLAEGEERVPFRGGGEPRDVTALESRTRMVPAVYGVHDYNYRAPLVNVAAIHRLESGSVGGVIEYGAHVKTEEEARALAQVRAEERGARRRVLSGRSDRPLFRGGARFTLHGHPRFDGELLLTAVEHAMVQPVGMHGGEGARSYSNTFEAIDGATPYRPARVTPKPRICGFVTGVVEPSPDLAEGEVDTFVKIDGEARYLVKFHFDTTPLGERRASRPVRMAQPHAGPGYGIHFPLRPGVEVIIGFAGGDPDRPVILGSVPNPLTPSPVSAATGELSSIRTESGIAIEFSDIG